ncbi:MAG: hypothetical protein J5589_03315 [Firmicutes bacterium]|nr:hypothetical protein [Bacillota bacterium]
MGLFGPAYMKNDRTKALSALEKETDKQKLIKAALSAPVCEVRERALIKVMDEEVFKKSALGDPNWKVRQTAVRWLKDQETLKKVAGQDEYSNVRRSALVNIQDETFKLIYAVKINDDDLAMTAAEGVRTEAGLAGLAIMCDKKAVVDYAVRNLRKFEKLSPEIVNVLRQSNDAQVKELLLPYEDEQTRTRTVRSITDPRKRSSIMGTLTDKNELYRLAVEDESRICRERAFSRLNELYVKQAKIDTHWWKEHIDPDTKDQRMAVLVKRSPQDQSAARELAQLLTSGKTDTSYIWPRVNKAVIEQLEKMLKDGSESAGTALYRLYKTFAGKPGPELAAYAEEQFASRSYQKHKDAMVDSSVCGETYRHDDYMYGEFMRPLE